MRHADALGLARRAGRVDERREALGHDGLGARLDLGVAAGRAALGGHSAPGAALYGSATGGPTYGSNSTGQLTTPSLDLSALSGDNLVTVSFNYYLSAEANFDFATVVYSIDGGRTYRTFLTSNGGALRNTPGGWENVVAELPGLAGFRDVRFGFRFQSDGNTEQEGFYIDDVEIVGVAGGSGFFAAPVQGTAQGGTTTSVTVTVNGAALDRGFYQGFVDLVTNQRGNDPAPLNVTFTVGAPAFPSITAVTTAPGFLVNPNTTTPATLNVRNPGDARLSYVRVLEPAASAYTANPNAFAGDAVTAAPPSASAVVSGEVASETAGTTTGTLPDGDILGQIVLTGAALPGDLTQMPDGRLLVLDIGLAAASYGQAFIVNEDLSGTSLRIPAAFTAQQSGLTYNSRTNSYWIAELSTGRVREVTLGGTAAAPTFVVGTRSFVTGFSPVGLAYSPELDAILTTNFGGTSLYAFDIAGTLLPGYPVTVSGRGPTFNQLPGLSFTDGVVEVGGAANLQIVQTGQFGRTFAGAVTTDETSARLGGSARINGFLRSRGDRDGSAYYVANPAGGVARVFRVDPPNLPAAITGTRIDAGAPLFGNQTVAAQAQFALPLLIDARGLSSGSYADQLAFLTNDQQFPLVRIPVTISVAATAGESEAPGVFALRGLFPNPVRSAGTVEFDLAEAADVTVGVYNTLGQRVAVLADVPAEAGAPVDVRVPVLGLASGVYRVVVTAGADRAVVPVVVVR